jgi:N-acetylglucosamine-6-phosphate deacetylase
MNSSLHSAPRPALFDLQVNGFAGVDFQQADLSLVQLQLAVETLHRYRMQRIFLTLITDEIDALASKLEKIERFRQEDEQVAETIPGYHIEGPYLSPEPGFRGAHPAEKMKAPDLREFERLQKAAGGNIRLITIAPEWKGSAAFIKELVQQGVVVSLGHTNASEEEIDQAIAAGASMCTHLGNGCPAEMHRHHNVMQRLLARDELIACFIPDGIHIPPGALKNLYRAKPPGKVLLTTDCMSAAGAPNGRYRLAGIEVEVGDDRVVRQPGSPTFAGSSLTLDQGVENFARWTGIDFDQAWTLASKTVAEVFDIDLPLLEPRLHEAPR